MNNGYGRIPTAIMKMNISKNIKLVLMCLCCYAGKRNYSFPSITTICKDLNMGRTTIINALKEAVNLKLIKIEKLYPDDPFKKHNKYILLFIETIENPKCSTPESPTLGLSTVSNRSPNVGLSKSQCRTKNNNININKHKKNKFNDSKESQKKDLIKSKLEENRKMFHKILWAFFTKASPEHFKTKDDRGREAPAIKRMITDALARAPTFDEQKTFLGNFLRTAKYVCNGHIKSFLNGSPFIPSVIMSKGIKPRILELMIDEIKQQDIIKKMGRPPV